MTKLLFVILLLGSTSAFTAEKYAELKSESEINSFLFSPVAAENILDHKGINVLNGVEKCTEFILSSEQYATSLAEGLSIYSIFFERIISNGEVRENLVVHYSTDGKSIFSSFSNINESPCQFTVN